MASPQWLLVMVQKCAMMEREVTGEQLLPFCWLHGTLDPQAATPRKVGASRIRKPVPQACSPHAVGARIRRRAKAAQFSRLQDTKEAKGCRAPSLWGTKKAEAAQGRGRDRAQRQHREKEREARRQTPEREREGGGGQKEREREREREREIGQGTARKGSSRARKESRAGQKERASQETRRESAQREKEGGSALEGRGCRAGPRRKRGRPGRSRGRARPGGPAVRSSLPRRAVAKLPRGLFFAETRGRAGRGGSPPPLLPLPFPSSSPESPPPPARAPSSPSLPSPRLACRCSIPSHPGGEAGRRAGGRARSWANVPPPSPAPSLSPPLLLLFLLLLALGRTTAGPGSARRTEPGSRRGGCGGPFPPILRPFDHHPPPF
uniref:Uncharacterized protein n=1 Tax=Pogona vitticeps TaxID=103695 RepID=A0ABM5ENX1_9SAUR